MLSTLFFNLAEGMGLEPTRLADDAETSTIVCLGVAEGVHV